MYSLVLLSAMTTGPGVDFTPSTEVFFRRSVGCTGCGGCTGYSCTGYSCGGCTGCYGSCHGHIFGFFHGHGLFGHRHTCQGCTGYSCTGYSCFGSCTGCVGCTGCYGSSMSWGGPVTYGSSALYGSVTNPNAPPVVIIPQAAPVEAKKDEMMGANIKFRLPADAKLYVDGRLTSLVGAERSFVTPPLAGGKFFYEARAELMVDGKLVVESKRVIVEAGSNLVESFPVLFAAIEGKADVIAGK